MKLEKLTEREKVEELGYPSYEAFLKTNQLISSILTDLYDKGKEIEEDLQIKGTLVNLATLLIAIRGKYERNGIKFEGKNVFSFKDLKDIFPTESDSFKEVYKQGYTSIELKTLITNAVSSILQGLETILCSVPEYNPKYMSKELDKSIKEILKEIKEYAKIGAKIGEILIDMKMKKNGYLIKAEMEKLTKTEDLMKKIKNDHMDKILSLVIEVHTGIYNLQFNGNYNNFLGESGEKINWIMILAKKIKETQYIITESQVAGRKQFLGKTLDGEAYIHTDAERVNNFVKEYGLISTLGEVIRQDEEFERLTDQVRSPFLNLEEKLNSVGIGYETAKQLSQYLSTNMLKRGSTNPKDIKEKKKLYIDFLKNIQV